MDNVETLTPGTRRGILLTGVLQGLFCALLMHYLARPGVPADSGWLVYGLPATLALSLTVMLSVVSFRQRRLWLALGAILLLVLGMSGWQKWNLYGLDSWDIRSRLFCYGGGLLVMALLMLPWLQRWLNSENEETDGYAAFHARLWHNGLALLLALLANGLVWLVLALWSALFELLGIAFFSHLFFDTDGFIYLLTGVITALTVVLVRSHGRLIAATRKLLTLVATGLLPLVSLLALLFIVTLPFVGLSAISRHTSAAGVLASLGGLLLLLAAAVWERERWPYPAALGWLVRLSLIVSPLYALLTAWSLWLRIQQYGWTPERLSGVLVALVLLAGSLGYLYCLLRRPQGIGWVNRGLTLLVLALLILLHTPLLDPWRIAVNSQLARYHSGKITVSQLSLSLLADSGRRGREALVALKNDPALQADAAQRRTLYRLLNGGSENAPAPSVETLKQQIAVLPGSGVPDDALWTTLLKMRYLTAGCEQADACLLMSQDLNGDGQREWVLYQFADRQLAVFSHGAKGWMQQGQADRLPAGLNAATLKAAKVGSEAKAWRDITLNGERVVVEY